MVYAGHETKAMLNNSGPRYKRSQLEQHMNLGMLFKRPALVNHLMIFKNLFQM